MLELRTACTGPWPEAAAELAALRDAVDRTLRDELGLRAAVAGLHPFAVRADVEALGRRRYREVEATMRALARREPTMAQHVHVAVPDADSAVRALDGLRGDLPVLLALSANSPFWPGARLGLRVRAHAALLDVPAHRHAAPLRRYGEYVAMVDAMLRARAIPEPSFLWWDARLQPRLGTVEVRMMDAQSRVLDVAALAALVQCLVRATPRAGRPTRRSLELLAENRFLAARDGIDAQLLDDRRADGRRAVRAALADLLEDCAPSARELGCAGELADAEALAADPGYARQRRYAARAGPRALLARLADEYAHPARASGLAGWPGAGTRTPASRAPSPSDERSRASSSSSREVWITSPPCGRTRSSSLSGAELEPSAISAAPPGAMRAPSCFMKSSLTPTSVILPASAPVAAPIAMPNSGARKSRPISPPHIAPPAAPMPVVLTAWCSLILPSC